MFLRIGILFLLIFSQMVQGSTEIGPKKNLFRVERIRIDGIKKIEEEAILEKIGVRRGMVLDNHLLHKDLQKIYGLKYFESVEAHHEVYKGQQTLVFKVVEKPIVSEIVFEGNSEIDDDDLKAKIKTKSFNILDVNTIKSDVTALQGLYEEKGFYLASVDFKLEKINKENTRLIFQVKEFEKVKVKQITFLGNRVFSDQQLQGIMETREESLFSALTNAGNFKEFSFQTDIERIKYFYKTKGYLQIGVGTPQITVSEDKRWVFITIRLTEGPKFTVNDIFFEGDLIFEDEELREKVSLMTGDDYSEEKLRKDIQALTELYEDQGYAFTNVLRTLNLVPGENKVNVTFSFEKGKMAYFGKIVVKGNFKTRDKVIRRELRIKEGERYSGTNLRISREAVNRLGFFEPGSVLFNTSANKEREDLLDVEIVVKERNTGQITVGAGYSTATKGFLQASIAQNNFRGLGQNLAFNLSLASNNKTYSLGFTEPYLFDTRWTAGFDIFRQSNDISTSIKYRSQGFDLRVGYPIFDFTRLFLTYKFEDIETSETLDPTLDNDVENGIASSVEAQILRDKRNNTFEPTGGSYASLSAEFTGLGGDQRWFVSEVDGRFYEKLVGDLVLRSRMTMGRIWRTTDRDVPRRKKYQLGGSRNMRGYNFEAIGPKRRLRADTNGDGVINQTDDFVTFNVRGYFSMYGTVELEHPLVREAGLKWVVFYDVGNVFEKHWGENGDRELRSDYGFGIRWFSPIGVLRFEFGYPINPRDDEPKSQFNFDIGNVF